MEVSNEETLMSLMTDSDGLTVLDQTISFFRTLGFSESHIKQIERELSAQHYAINQLLDADYRLDAGYDYLRSR